MKIIKNLILLYLRFLAKIQLWKVKPIVVGIGGASGKTSLANFIYLILKDKYKIRQGKGKNSETGLPLNILGISISNYSIFDWLKVVILAPLKILFDWKKYEIYVAEMGIDSPKEPKNMSYLLKIIKPDIAVLTNISFEHSQYFEEVVKKKSIEETENEIFKLTSEQELLLLNSLGKNKTAILNLDDLEISNSQDKIISNKITVSKNKSDFKISKILTTTKDFIVEFEHLGNKYSLKLNQSLTEHFAYSIVLAIATGFALDVKIEDAISSIENNFSLPPGRMTVFAGVNDSTIIDSTYNSSPLPLLDLLDFLKNTKGKRKLAILGDMRELGVLSKKLHEEVAEKIIKTSDAAILIGPLMAEYVYPILKQNNFNVKFFNNFSQVKDQLKNLIEEEDIILVKASQNTLFLERAVELLLKNPQDKQKLCRRGNFWDKKRHQSL